MHYITAHSPFFWGLALSGCGPDDGSHPCPSRFQGEAIESRTQRAASGEDDWVCTSSKGQYLLLHDGGSAGDAVAVQGGVDGVAWPLEEGTSNALCTGCHRCSILTAQLLHQLSKLSSQMRTCVGQQPQISHNAYICVHYGSVP